jgi:hypothetical protein
MRICKFSQKYIPHLLDRRTPGNFCQNVMRHLDDVMSRPLVKFRHVVQITHLSRRAA